MRCSSFARPLGLFAILLGLAGVSSASAQTGKITGLVTDAATGLPVDGVQVSLQGSGRGATTGANGRYFIVNVSPGTFTVLARRIGYQTATVTNVQALIDVTTEVNFRLASSSGELSTVRVSAASEPLIQPGTTGSQTAITAREIATLPTASIASILALQLGFLNVPVENTDVTAYVDERRGVTSERIRGGRANETLTLIDGIPINNFVLGGRALDITTKAIEQLNYQRGGFEAQYGNAMSGINNIATREGSATLQGELSYSSSRFAGMLGSTPDSLSGRDIIDGVLTGPVPGTAQKLRWMVAGRQSTGANRVLEFDNNIFDPFRNRGDVRGNTTQAFDLFPGWRSTGFSTSRNLYGKLTTYFTPTMKLNLGAVGYQAQTQGFNPAWVLTGYNMVDACNAAYPTQSDYCDRYYGRGNPTRIEDVMNGGASSFQTNQYSIQGSTRQDRTLAWGKFNHTIDRTSYTVAAGRLYTARNTCNYLTGVCLGDKIRNFTTAQSFVRGRFLTPAALAPYTNPGAGSENFAGGDTNTTYSIRGDVQSQVTDHHNLQGGIFFQQHDISFYEAKNVQRPFDNSGIANYTYGGKPWDAAIYVQDKIEYDFLTLKLGFRFDYGRADGRFFKNPTDPTNGTTVFEVCEGQAFGDTAWKFENTAGRTFEGIAACSKATDSTGNFFLMDSARAVAFQDDFASAPIRRQFSPRVGVQFPLSERSSFFANYGVYSQNPIYNTMYQGTGIGRRADSTFVDRTRIISDSIRKGQSLQGTPYGPNFRSDLGFVPIIGNPRLETERTTSYEIGFLTEIGTLYAAGVTGFAKDQSGLTGFRQGGRRGDGGIIVDQGQTYSTTGSFNYLVLVNTDFQTVRGLELMFKRRLEDFWAFDVKYGFQQVFTNAAPPELEAQKIIEGDVSVREEVRSEIDQPHLFTGILRFQVDDRAPEVRLGKLLTNSALTFTTRIASGFPYTPCTDFNCTPALRLERNSGTGPTTWETDMYAAKAWRTGNLKYSAFVSVTNLFDRMNCIQPYPTTGRCDAGAFNIYKSIVGPYNTPGSPVGSVIATGATTTQFDLPNLFGVRRQILSGFRVSF